MNMLLLLVHLHYPPHCISMQYLLALLTTFILYLLCSFKTCNLCIVILLLLQPFYDPLSGTTQVSRYQKDKPFWILLKWWSGSGITEPHASYLHFAPEDNHASTSSVRFLRARCSSWHPTNSVKALKENPQKQQKNSRRVPDELWHTVLQLINDQNYIASRTAFLCIPVRSNI